MNFTFLCHLLCFICIFLKGCIYGVVCTFAGDTGGGGLDRCVKTLDGEW